MAPSVLVLGIDPGLASCGLAVLDVAPERPRVVAVRAFASKPSARKRHTYASDDTYERASALAEAVAEYLAGGPGSPEPVRAVCVEAMSYPRHASAAHKMGVAWGTIAAVVSSRRVPLVQASPQKIKTLTAGARNASKGAVALAVAARVDGLEAALRDVRETAEEHVFDAIGAVLACSESPVLRVLQDLGGRR
jgi:crossover junction endodeoxyribonuclease RuvC